MVLAFANTRRREWRVWCWVTPCSCEQGMLWRQHPSPGLFGDQCDGFSVPPMAPRGSVSAKAQALVTATAGNSFW